MRVVSLLVLVFLCAAPASASAAVWLAEFSSSGLTPDESRDLHAQVWSELGAIGAVDVGQPTDAACAEREACLAKRHVELGADAALVLRLLRAGPLLQVSTTLVRAGEEPWREERLLQTKELAAGGALLATALLERLRGSEAPLPNATAAPDVTAESLPAAARVATDPGPAQDEAADPSPPVAPAATTTEGEVGPPLLGITGLGLAAAGLVIAVVGGAIAAGGNEVLLDPASAADEKAQASFYGPVAIGAAATGAAVALAGAAVAVVGFSIFE